MQLNQLIDEAAAIAGSEYKLALTLGVPQQNLSNWKHGHRPCPIDLRAVMASIAGQDPQEELIEAIGERLSDERRDRLRMALKSRQSTISRI